MKITLELSPDVETRYVKAPLAMTPILCAAC